MCGTNMQHRCGIKGAWDLRHPPRGGAPAACNTERLDGGDATHVAVGGMSLMPGGTIEPEETPGRILGLPDFDERAKLDKETRTMTARELIAGSSFQLSSNRAGPGQAQFTAWGRVATGGFEAEEDRVTMDGDVTTGLVGFDARWHRALAGVMFSKSEGKGSCPQVDPAKGHGDAGTVESSLTVMYPYASLKLNARVSAWALAGMGSGELALHPAAGERMATDISLRMGAIGIKGRVLDGTGPSGVGLDVRSDAMWVGTKSADTPELAPSEGAVTRVRLVAQGERTFDAGNGATFTPSAQVGLRHDGGDAETGTGVEAGAGVRYAVRAVTIEAQARTLLVHEASGYEKWGLSGSIGVSPGASGRGLTLSVAPTWGQAGSAAERLWSAHDTRGLGTHSGFKPERRVDIEAGYGIGIGHRRGVLTPYAGMAVGDSGDRTVRTGARWQMGPDTVVGVEATRQTTGANEAASEVKLSAALRF